MTTATPELILASASPRRADILRSLAVNFEIVVPDVNEVHWDEHPESTVRENARLKGEWAQRHYPGRPLIAADTVVVFDGRCVGKPTSRDEARAWLQQFAGRSQSVLTGTALARPNAPLVAHLDAAEVRFKPFDADAIARYLTLVDPLDKAGAYDIGRHADLIIDSYTGSLTTIMGLCRERINTWLREWR